MKLHLLSKVDETIDYIFRCPGCGCGHRVRISGPGHNWQWNGSLKLPTFSPSILVNPDFPMGRCHSFVRDGKIQFLADSWHGLKGLTVEIPEWDE